MANSCVVQMLHSIGQVPEMADSYAVPRLCNVGLVPGMAIMDGYHLICTMTVLMSSYHGNSVNLSKLIISFDCGQQL